MPPRHRLYENVALRDWRRAAEDSRRQSEVRRERELEKEIGTWPLLVLVLILFVLLVLAEGVV